MNKKALTKQYRVSSGKNAKAKFDPLKHTSLTNALQAYEDEYRPRNRFVLVFAHSKLYDDSPRHALLVKKKPNSRHGGLLNLPGGKIEYRESPRDAAIRELKEETNIEATWPQLVGAILPGPMDEMLKADPFIVYIYRVMSAPGADIKFPEDQPASWHFIKNSTGNQYVPGLAVILPLIAANQIGFIVEDVYWGPMTADRLETRQSRFILSFLRHSVADAADIKKKASFET